MLLLLVVNLVLLANVQSILNQRFDYAVQIHPVIFLTQPQSQVVHENQTVTLSCQARVAHIVDRTYPLPTISWRYNGITLNTADSSKTIISNVPTGHSQLIMHNVSNYDTGQYQCVANDANGNYITISEPAYLTVLHTNPTQYVTADLFQPLLLNCEVPLDNTHITWTFNETTTLSSNEDVRILSNGSLLIFSFTNDNQGIWSCIVQYDQTIAAVSSFIISHSNIDNYNVNSTKFILTDANVSYPELGDSISIYCLIGYVEYSQIVWYFNTDIILQQSEVENESTIVIDSLNYTHVGSYMCQVISQGGNIINSSVYSLSINNYDLYVSHLIPSVVLLNCSSPTDLIDVIWFKNGKKLDHNHTYLQLTSSDSFGIYQCFYDNKQLSLIRILVKGLSNPVGDIFVQAEATVSQAVISLNISWSPPIQRGDGINGLVYSISISRFNVLFGYPVPIKIIEHNDGTNYRQTTLTLQSVGDLRGNYYISIDIQSDAQGLQPSPACFDPKVPYYMMRNLPFLKQDNDRNLTVSWDSPSPFPSSYPIEHLFFNITCIYGDFIQHYNYYKPRYSETSFKYTIPSLPAGTVCQVFGKYKLTDVGGCPQSQHMFSEYRLIPAATIQIEPVSDITGSSQLSLYLLSGVNNVSLYWKIQETEFCMLLEDNKTTLNVDGVCYYRGNMTVVPRDSDINMTSLVGRLVTYTDILNDSICTFVASINGTNISSLPVQFIMGKRIKDVYKFKDVSLTESPKCHTDTDESYSYTANDESIPILSTNAESIATNPTMSTNTESIATKPTMSTNTESKHTMSTPADTNINESEQNELSKQMVVMSSIFGAVITIVVLILIILLITMFFVRQRRKKLMFKIEDDADPYNMIYLDDPYNFDSISLKTEFNSPYYVDPSLPAFTTQQDMSLSLDDFFSLVSEKVHSTHLSINESTTSLADDITETMEISNTCTPTNLPEENERNQQTLLPADAKCNHCSSTVVDVRVGRGGFMFQVDVPCPSRDTSGCSSGYGSDMTALSCIKLNDYHNSLEPDLIEVEQHQLHVVNKMPMTNDLPCHDSCHHSLPRKGSCPNLFPGTDELICHSDTFNDDNFNMGMKSSQSVDSMLSESCNSSGSESSYLNVNKPTNDRLPTNVLYVDEKGYIHFVCNKRTNHMCSINNY